MLFGIDMYWPTHHSHCWSKLAAGRMGRFGAGRALSSTANADQPAPQSTDIPLQSISSFWIPLFDWFSSLGQSIHKIEDVIWCHLHTFALSFRPNLLCLIYLSLSASWNRKYFQPEISTLTTKIHQGTALKAFKTQKSYNWPVPPTERNINSDSLMEIQ